VSVVYAFLDFWMSGLLVLCLGAVLGLSVSGDVFLKLFLVWVVLRVCRGLYVWFTCAIQNDDNQ
jgi:hypothetical protein